MRLASVDNGHAFAERVKLRFMRFFMGREPFDIIKTVFYRPDLLGKPMSALTQAVMRGPSDWKVGERELFAAFVSRQNQCPF